MFEILKEQQKKFEPASLEYGIAEMIKATFAVDFHAEQIIEQDLVQESMSLEDCGKKLYDYAQKHKSGSSYFMTPAVAEKLVREFYGLGTDTGDMPDTAKAAPVSLNLMDLI